MSGNPLDPPLDSFWKASTAAKIRASLETKTAFKTNKKTPPNKIGNKAKILAPTANSTGPMNFFTLTRPKENESQH
jgi:hypothetical protein